MATHRVSAADLPKTLRQQAAGIRGLIRKGQDRAAFRGKARLVRAASEKGKTDQRQYRNSFKVSRGVGARGPQIVNDAPHAGIIELGARPHPVSPEGVEAIKRWVARKMLGISAVEAEENEPLVEQITWGIVRKLNLHGQEPTYVFRDELPTLTRYLKQEVERLLREAHKPGGGA